MRILSFLLLFLVIVSCEPILMAISDDKPASFEIKEDKAYVNGVLGKKAHQNFLEMVKKYPTIQTLVLQQVPGSVNNEWNVKTCLEVHKRGMNTVLESNSVIESGGVDLFIAGIERTSQEGAKIGVHSWRTLSKDGTEFPPDHEEHAVFYDYFKAINRDTSGSGSK